MARPNIQRGNIPIPAAYGANAGGRRAATNSEERGQTDPVREMSFLKYLYHKKFKTVVRG